MGENAPPPPPQVVARPSQMPLGAAKGPIWTPTEQLHHLQYCIHSNPSWPETFVLAFQHYVVMLGSIVIIATSLVPRMGGDHGDKARVIQTMLFMAAINTLIQTLIGTRLPTVMTSSFAFTLPVMSIINDYSDRNFRSEHERFETTMRTIQGSLIVASFFNIFIGFSRAWGNFTRFFSPIVIVPVVCVVGLGLFARGFPVLANCVETGLPMLILLVSSQQYLRCALPRAHNILERFPYPFQWGKRIFRASHVFGMMGAAIVTSAESTEAYFAAARLSGATPPPPSVASQSTGLQGVGMLPEGIFGAAVGTTASVENVGLLGLTHTGSRRAVQISTTFMFFFSIFGKFGAFFASIPLPMFAAMYCVLFGIVAAVGITFIQFANNNSLRNIYVLGLSLFLGISIPQYFVSNTWCRASQNGWHMFDDILNTIFSSSPTVATIVGTPLDNTLHARHAANDRGLAWWRPFQSRKGDARN